MKQRWIFKIPSERKYSWGWVALVCFLTFSFFYRHPLSGLSRKPIVIEPGSATSIEASTWHNMKEHIDQISRQHDGKVGIYIKDLKTGATYEKDSDEQFVTASLIKLPIMAATFNAIEEKKFSLDDSFKLKSHHKRGGSGQLKRARAGRKYRVSDLMYRMITESDNTATAILIEKLGYGYLNERFADFGLIKTRINPIGMRLDDSINPEHDNYTTAREMGELLEKIYLHEVATYGHCDLMMDWMKHAEGRARLRRYLPKTWNLASKGGLLRKNCHDVGIVFTPRRDYVICVLTGKNRTYRRAIGLIANVGQTAYTYLERS